MKRVVGAGVALIMSACVVASCTRQTVDLGRNDASTTTPAALQEDSGVFPSGYGCSDFIDQEISNLRGSTCTGACGDHVSTVTPYKLESHEELEAATAGEWLYCTTTAPLGPKEAIGLEFAPGCRIFFLTYDPNGEIIRGTTAEYQADYDIYDLSDPTKPKRIDINLKGAQGEDVHTFDVKVSHCPNRIELTSVDGKTVIELSSDFGDAGRGPPVVK